MREALFVGLEPLACVRVRQRLDLDLLFVVFLELLLGQQRLVFSLPLGFDLPGSLISSLLCGLLNHSLFLLHATGYLVLTLFVHSSLRFCLLSQPLAAQLMLMAFQQSTHKARDLNPKKASTKGQHRKPKREPRTRGTTADS